ncbi:MAG: SDR family NAD(P)-dependent oxidoreductase [Rhodospirillales bacterium]|nr:SDR family NAD(P)-dependent oxidoreductase [Rhodospirillales bacterium]
MHVLITGGAGFIGSHVCDELLGRGRRVRVLDNLDEQVHEQSGRPAYLAADAELVVGDVRDRGSVEAALRGIDAVIHLAACVGVGQSMYEIGRYTGVNDYGTAVLLQALSERSAASPLARLVVASSMSIYGEGLMIDDEGRVHDQVERSGEQLRRGRWEIEGPSGAPLRPLPTPESKRPALNSVYALGKYAQERMCLVVGRAYGVETVALRLFNVYGTRQALSNPYTGVLAIFASRLLNGKPPRIFEDGLQRRDFVHVRDVARAFRLALEAEAAVGHAVNIASGESVTIRAVGERLAAALGVTVEPITTGRYRVGDIRHCFADPSLARRALNFEAEVAATDGFAELVAWLASEAAVDRVEAAQDELLRRGLVA